MLRVVVRLFWCSSLIGVAWLAGCSGGVGSAQSPEGERDPEFRIVPASKSGEQAGTIGGGKRIVIRGTSTCVILSSGEVECWNRPGVAGPAPFIGKFKQLFTQQGSLCGLRSNGKPACESNQSLEGYRARGEPAFTQVASSVDQTVCGLNETGNLECLLDSRGLRGFRGSVNTPRGTFVSLVGSQDAFRPCALDANGAVRCWGVSQSAMLGVAAVKGDSAEDAGPFEAIATNCGILKRERTVRCWRGPKLPEELSGTRVNRIVDGPHDSTCARSESGTWRCWGKAERVKATDPGYVDVAFGILHACGLLPNDRVQCWGYDAGGMKPPQQRGDFRDDPSYVLPESVRAGVPPLVEDERLWPTCAPAEVGEAENPPAEVKGLLARVARSFPDELNGYRVIGDRGEHVLRCGGGWALGTTFVPGRNWPAKPEEASRTHLRVRIDRGLDDIFTEKLAALDKEGSKKRSNGVKESLALNIVKPFRAISFHLESGPAGGSRGAWPRAVKVLRAAPGVFVEVWLYGRDAAFFDGGNAGSLFTGLALSEFAKLQAPAATKVRDASPCAVGAADLDADGLADACDPDDDNDGFDDTNDPWPNDKARPGDYSTPEKLIADEKVSRALAAFRKAGHRFPIETGVSPPDLSGHYLRTTGEGTMLVSKAGNDTGVPLAGVQERWRQQGNALTEAGASVTEERVLSITTSVGTLVRGEGQRYTLFSRNSVRCLDGKPNATLTTVTIRSGVWDENGARRVNERSLTVVLDARGGCPNHGWWAAETESIHRVQADALDRLCVDERMAYVRGETWTRKDGAPCRCTPEHAVACGEGP
jgi:hypothetical protein